MPPPYNPTPAPVDPQLLLNYYLDVMREMRRVDFPFWGDGTVPENWNIISNQIDYFLENYDEISYTEVNLTDGSSYNYPIIPGLNIDTEKFFGHDTAGCIGIMLHESCHDLSSPTGPTHFQIDPHFPPYSQDNTYDKYIKYLQYTQIDNTSIWEMILENVGPKPKKK
jgi:hypothetical protein